MAEVFRTLADYYRERNKKTPNREDRTRALIYHNIASLMENDPTMPKRAAELMSEYALAQKERMASMPENRETSSTYQWQQWNEEQLQVIGKDLPESHPKLLTAGLAIHCPGNELIIEDYYYQAGNDILERDYQGNRELLPVYTYLSERNDFYQWQAFFSFNKNLNPLQYQESLNTLINEANIHIAPRLQAEIPLLLQLDPLRDVVDYS